MRVTGWRCAVCGATVDIATPFPWRCPNSTDTDRHHVLTIVNADPAPSPDPSPDQSADRLGSRDASRTDRVEAPLVVSSLIAHDDDLAWAAFAEANGLDRDARIQLVEQTDAAVRRVAGAGFVPTPFARSDELSDELGFDADGGVWVKNETGGVAGSQKARHLVTILLHLLAAESVGHLTERPRLAIASCGNAALAGRDARGRRRVADRRLRAHLDDRRLRHRARSPRRDGPPVRTSSGRPPGRPRHAAFP